MDHDTTDIEALGRKIAESAMRTFAKLCPEACQASDHQLEVALHALRAETDPAVDEMIQDMKDAPHMANYAYANAVMRLAQAGAKAFRAAAH